MMTNTNQNQDKFFSRNKAASEINPIPNSNVIQVQPSVSNPVINPQNKSQNSIMNQPSFAQTESQIVKTSVVRKSEKSQQQISQQRSTIHHSEGPITFA